MTKVGWRSRPVPALLVLVALLLAGAVVPAGPAAGAERRPARLPSWPSGTVPGSLLVTTTDGRVEVVEVTPGDEALEAARLSTRPGVVAVEPDHLRPALRVPDAGRDPDFPSQWSHTMARAPEAWDVTTGSRAIEVAVVDSGVDGRHRGLRANLVHQVDVSSGQVEERPLGVDNDACGAGHGTFVAGVLGAVGNDPYDVAGAAWEVGIVDVAAGDPARCGSFADSAVVAAIAYATDRGVDVINLSLGGPADTCPTAFQAAVDAARAQEIVVVAAAGNEERYFPGLTSVPASCRGVISVGAVGPGGAHAWYSNANDHVDLAAPGGDEEAGGGVISTWPGGGVNELEGTSFAAPYVAGAAALVRSLRPDLSADAVEAVLETTAVGTGGQRTARFGWGRVDLAAAVALAASAVTEASLEADLRDDPPFPVGLVVRISAQQPVTDAVQQAAAISRYVFADGRARHAVLARSDDFADALAGSALGFGAGPVLFTDRSGPLDPTTAAELTRVLPPGGVVYLLGGSDALPAGLDDELRRQGFDPVRLAGTTREATAAVVAEEVALRLQDLGFAPPTRVILATARNWPDAVSGGSLAAWFGYPVLLTDPHRLSPASRDRLAAMQPERLYVVGGSDAVSHAVADAARSAGGGAEIIRLAGVDRSGTAIAVARRFTAEFQADTGLDPILAIGVNLRRADGFAHVLSASAAIGAFSGVYLPVEGDGGDDVPDVVVPFACSLDPVRGVVAGDPDLVGERARERLNALLEHTAPDCP